MGVNTILSIFRECFSVNFHFSNHNSEYDVRIQLLESLIFNLTRLVSFPSSMLRTKIYGMKKGEFRQQPCIPAIVVIRSLTPYLKLYVVWTSRTSANEYKRMHILDKNSSGVYVYNLQCTKLERTRMNARMDKSSSGVGNVPSMNELQGTRSDSLSVHKGFVLDHAGYCIRHMSGQIFSEDRL